VQICDLKPSKDIKNFISKRKPSMDKTFTPFSRLSTELRLKIWRTTLPLFPRILEARPHKPWSESARRPRTPKWTITPTTTTPLLSINQEARNELKKYYAAPFNPHNVFPTQGSTIDFRLHARGFPDVEPYPEIDFLYFNYKVDILFIDTTDLYYLWPEIYTFSEIISSIFRAAYPDAQTELRRLAGSEDFWDTIVLQKNESEEKVLEEFVSTEENIMVFGKGVLGKNDKLVRFEDVEESEWTGEERLYFDQFPKVEGVLVKNCRGVGRRELESMADAE